MKIRFWVWLTLICLSSCVTVPIKPTIEDSITLQSSFNKVWTATVATLPEKALPIEVIEKESGLITTKFVIFTDGLIAQKAIDRVSQRPSVFMGTWEKGRYTLSIFITSEGENTTKVKITIYIEAYEGNVTKSWNVCYSKGVIEKDIFEVIKSKV